MSPLSCLLDVSFPSWPGGETRVGACRCCCCRVDDESTEPVSLYMASPAEKKRGRYFERFALWFHLPPLNGWGGCLELTWRTHTWTRTSGTRDLHDRRTGRERLGENRPRPYLLLYGRNVPRQHNKLINVRMRSAPYEPHPQVTWHVHVVLAGRVTASKQSSSSVVSFSWAEHFYSACDGVQKSTKSVSTDQLVQR